MLKFYLASIISVSSTPLWEKGRIWIRIHTSWLTDPDSGRPTHMDPDPQHWFWQNQIFFYFSDALPRWARGWPRCRGRGWGGQSPSWCGCWSACCGGASRSAAADAWPSRCCSPRASRSAGFCLENKEKRRPSEKRRKNSVLTLWAGILVSIWMTKIKAVDQVFVFSGYRILSS